MNLRPRSREDALSPVLTHAPVPPSPPRVFSVSGSNAHRIRQKALRDVGSRPATAGRTPSPATAAVNYEFGEVTTRAGNGRSHERGRAARRGRRFEILTGLFRDLEGILMP